MEEQAAAARELRETIDDAGGLIGVNASAKLLGIQGPNFRRYRPRLTEIEVEGSAAVFVRREVEALRDALHDEREARHAAARSGG